MAKFEFRLASLERLRIHTRDERRAYLAEALDAQRKLEERVLELENNLRALRKMQTLGAGKVNVDRLLDAGRYEMLMRLEQQQAGQQLEAVKVEVERRREMLVAADREVKVLEKLEQTERARFDEEQRRREVKEMDEIASRG